MNLLLDIFAIRNISKGKSKKIIMFGISSGHISIKQSDLQWIFIYNMFLCCYIYKFCAVVLL
jgi:hypothetical protein